VTQAPTQKGPRPLNTPSQTCFLGIVVPIRKSETGHAVTLATAKNQTYETCGES